MKKQAVKEKPLLGWGRENFSLGFNKYFNPAFEKAKLGEAWEDRAHNIFLEEAINGGLFGLSSYLIFILIFLFFLRKNHLFTAALLAYLLQGFFGVNTLNEQLPLFLLVAHTDFFILSQHPFRLNETKKHPLWRPVLISLTACIFIVAALFIYTIEPARGNKNIFKATYAVIDNNNRETFDAAYKKGKNILKNFPYQTTELISISGTALIQSQLSGKQNNDLTPYFDIFLADLKTLIQRNPLEYRGISLYGQFLRYQAIMTKNVTLFN